jgi:hypothetical protein
MSSRCPARKLRVSTLALVALVAPIVACEDRSLGPGHYRWEGIRGFAIWPEDQPEAGLEACDGSVDEEPWRRQPGATAERFLRSVLHWSRPPQLDDGDVPEDAPRTAFSVIDGSMSDSALGVVVHLRRLRGCWFIAAVWPREGDIAARYRWVKRDEEYVLRASWRGEEPINLEVGWGERVRVTRLRKGDSVSIRTPDETLPGHVLWFPDRPSEGTFGQPLSPPPRIP